LAPVSTELCYTAGVAYYQGNSATMASNKIENLASVDIVFTNDRSKWTRVPVFEAGTNPSQCEGGQKALWLRDHASVDKNGNVGDGIVSADPNDADFISATGMGWFPGYAINVETGERLNMGFAENSSLVAEHGRDMLWNPTAHEADMFNGEIFGGQHYIYVFGHNGNAFGTSGPLTNKPKDVPAYDYGAAIVDILKAAEAANDVAAGGEVFRDAMWASVPMLSEDFANWSFNYASDPLPCDVNIKLRVARPYKRMLTGIGTGLIAQDSVSNSQNGNHPMYRFDTHDLKVTTNDNLSAVNALDLINVVPNPYYAYSGYETSQLDNRVKFTNLPEKCTIKIFTVSGTQIRMFTKDSPQTSMDWDLKNQAGIPIASGLYIIHVEVPGVGEKILKWFGVMRPIDLDAY
jgi:hypothetical protein